MCYFIAIEMASGLPPLPDGVKFTNCPFDANGRTGATVSCITDGHCSCTLISDPKRRAAKLDAKVKKYKKKGWSTAKIDRAVSSMKPQRSSAHGSGSDFQAFQSWIAQCVAASGSLRMLVHWASASSESIQDALPFALSHIGKTALPEEVWLTVT